jgi:hypothetical protein
MKIAFVAPKTKNMGKRILKISILPVFAAFLFFGFSSKNKNTEFEILTSNLPESYTVSSKENTPANSKVIFPKLGKGYTAFKEAVGFKESRGDYQVINQFGYLGKYQFGKSTLSMIGIYDTQKFLNSPEMQEAAFYANAARNKWVLRNYIEKYSGKTINGVKITESGILAAAHLGGAGSVKRYLRSGGTRYFSDAFGSTISHYLNRFKGYNTDFIVADRNAKVSI